MSAGRLDDVVTALSGRASVGLMTHVVLGYPTLGESVDVVRAMAAAGADVIEIQIPFSDPSADGSTIMHACDVALRNGVVPDDAFRAVREISSSVDTPLLLMGYYNTWFRYGVERFCVAAADAGVAGFIVPDIPAEEEADEHFIEHCQRNDLHHIRIVSPASTEQRLRSIGSLANGFVYCLSRYGTTGATADLDARLTAYLDRVRAFIHVPIAVGFGISRPEHVRSLRGHAEIAVVGSAVLDLMRGKKPDDYLPGLDAFLRSMLAG